MSNTVISIKRSNTTGVPAANTLNIGELAYSYNTSGGTGSGVLFIGPRFGITGAASNVAINIGGYYYTSQLDNAIAGGFQVTPNTFVYRDNNGSIWANVVHGNIIGSVTIAGGSVNNTMLQNSTIYINTGSGLAQNNLPVALGSAVLISVNVGDGISTSNAGTLNVDSTVVRTFGAQTIAGAKTFSNDVAVQGNLLVTGTFTAIDTTITTIEDPQIVLGTGVTAANGQTANLTTNDGKDRGIVFNWYNGGFGGQQANTQNVGFFGWQNTSHRLIYKPDAGNAALVWAGNDGDAQFGRIFHADTNLAAPSITFTNEANTGFWRISGGQVGFTIKGVLTEIANTTGTYLSNGIFQSLGNVSLGTASLVTIDNVGGRMGIGSLTGTPMAMDALLTISANVGGFAVPNAGSSAIANTNVHIIGQNGAQGGLLVDAFAGVPLIIGRRADGNSAIPLALATDDKLISIRGYGFGANAYDANVLAAIEFGAGQTFTDPNKGTYIRFLTTALNTNTGAVEHVRIDPQGNVGIGITAPTSLLHVSGSLRATANIIFDTGLGIGQGGTGKQNFGTNTVLLGSTTNPLVEVQLGSQGTIFQIDVNGNPAFGTVDCGAF